MSLTDGAGTGTVAIRKPCSGQCPTIAAAAAIAAGPVAPVGPVDLAAIVAERAGDELPSGRLNLVGALQISRRGVAILIGESEENAVAGDGGMLAGISLRAPRAQKSGGLAAIHLK